MTSMTIRLRHVGALLLLAAALLVLASCDRTNDSLAAEISQPGLAFNVEIDGKDAGHFSAATGIELQVEAVEYQDGDDPVTRKRPGRVKYGDITLKRAYTGDRVLSDWAAGARFGTLQLRKISVEIWDQTRGVRLQRIDFLDCFPTSWRLDADSDGDGLGETIRISIGTFQEDLTRSG